MTLALSLLLAQSPALACGGFFCDPVAPVEQAGERIVFGVSAQNGTVETHVEVAYEGPAESFAWIVPTPAPPDPFISPTRLFDVLENATAPSFQLTNEFIGDCFSREQFSSDPTDDSTMDSDVPVDAEDTDGGGSVVVVATENVGAYDTVTLQATSSDALLDWLQANNYDLPDELSASLDPYIADGSYFIAIKLEKGASVGDLQPLGLRYEGSEPVIPIQLTRIAALPDMPITVWVLGPSRAVPKNYLHVRINEVAYDWLNRSRPYNDLVTRAANEAGGQAFATDFAGEDNWERLWGPVPDRDDIVDTLTATDDLVAFIRSLRVLNAPMNEEMVDLLQTCVTSHPGESLSIPDVLSDPDGIDWEARGSFDVDACTEAILDRYVDPFIGAHDLLREASWVTRLTSSVSPDEMTLDPLFVFNNDMPSVPAVRQATMVFDCSDALLDDAPRDLELPSGLTVPLLSTNEMARRGISYLEWVGEQDAAIVIEATSADEAPMFVVDHRDEVKAFLETLSNEPGAGVGAGCGCSSTSSGGWWFALLLPLLARRRR